MRSRHCRDKKHRKHQTHLISKDSHKYCRLLLPVSEDDEASEIKSRRRSKHDHSKAVNAVRFLVHKTRKLDPAFIKSGFFSFNIYVDCQLHLVYCLTTKISILSFLPPATKLGQGNIFRSVCQQFCPWGGPAWLHQGGMHGFIRGACVVLFGGSYVVLFGGGMRGFIWGGHMCFYSGGMHDFIWGGACMVLLSGGRAWFFQFFRIQ